MSKFTHDRVQETGTGTNGDITLTGAVTGFGSFASRYAVGEPFFFACVDGSTWGVFRGYLSGSSTLVREYILESSSITGTAPNISFNDVTFSGTSMNVFVTLPSYMVDQIYRKGRSTALNSGLALL